MTRAILAAIIATIVLSLILIAQGYFALFPEFRLIDEWQELLSRFGLPAERWVAWLGNSVVGAVIYGVMFSALRPILPGPGLGEGIAFGIVAWLLMMLVFMPLTGNGFFAVALGTTVILATLGLHLVYGAVLGIGYGLLAEDDDW